jgi:hypothetical protein
VFGVKEEKSEEAVVRNPDILTLVLFRYFLEEATKLSHERLVESEQMEEVCSLFEPATQGLITPEQLEYVLMYYSQRPEELQADIDSTLATISFMMNKALTGE